MAKKYTSKFAKYRATQLEKGFKETKIMMSMKHHTMLQVIKNKTGLDKRQILGVFMDYFWDNPSIMREILNKHLPREKRINEQIGIDGSVAESVAE